MPTVHVDPAAGAAIKAYAATREPDGVASRRSRTNPVRAPAMAGFSSFGPALAGGGDLLKPDITAPGVDVIAAVAPAGPRGQQLQRALRHLDVRAAHRRHRGAAQERAPDVVADVDQVGDDDHRVPTDNTGQPIQRVGNATPLNFGAGHVVPAGAFDPGLVYDSDFDGLDPVRLRHRPVPAHQWSRRSARRCPPIDPSDLNYPSIAVGDLAGTQTVTRTVTNITQRASTSTGWRSQLPGLHRYGVADAAGRAAGSVDGPTP